MIIDMVRSNCTFVELHHWDVAAAQAFRAFGYEMATIIRDPVRRIASSFNYANERSNATAALIERFYSGVRTPDRTLGFLTGCYGCCSGLQHLRDGAPGYRSQDDASHSDCSIAPQQCAILRATAAATEALGVVAGYAVTGAIFFGPCNEAFGCWKWSIWGQAVRGARSSERSGS